MPEGGDGVVAAKISMLDSTVDRVQQTEPSRYASPEAKPMLDLMVQ